MHRTYSTRKNNFYQYLVGEHNCRVQATRRLIGGGDIIKKRLDKEHHKSLDMVSHLNILMLSYSISTERGNDPSLTHPLKRN